MCDNEGMKFRTGFIVGAAVGYVLGAKAGRERYDQIKSAFDRFQGNEQIHDLVEKGKAVAGIGADRVSQGLHQASDAIRDLADD
jgi:hypothetical protein